MANKVPVVVFVDPEAETNLTIKPFAAGLATKGATVSADHPNATTGTASATGTNLQGQADVDANADADF